MATPATDPRRGPEGSPFALGLDHSTPVALSRLPPGRHGLPREFVEANHRNRLLAGAVDAIAEHGYLATTVADVTKAAAVSRRTFYLHFTDKEACFLAAHDLVSGWIGEEIERATERSESWPQGVRAAVGTTLDIFAADPRLARLCTVEVFLAGPAAVLRQEALIDRLCLFLRAGRTQRPLGAELPPRFEHALIVGAISLIPRHLNVNGGDRLGELAPELSEFLLAPYLGVAEARRVAESGNLSEA